MNRIIAYIDGYNFFHALNDLGWKRYFWLDYQELCKRLLKINQELVMTKYFTARTTGSTTKKQRQNTYIEALQTLNYFEVIEGRFQDEPYTCPNCKKTRTIPKEKKTDVNIAVHIICDCFMDKFDYAFLLTADADLAPIIEAIKQIPQFAEKRVVIVIPPGRKAEELKSVAHAYLHTGRSDIAQSQLPPRITREDGFILERPPEWT